MLSNSILLPPSPNWYGSQLVAAQPSAGLVAYAGHNSVVIADTSSSRIIRTLCAAPARVTAIAWAPDTLTRYQLVAGHEDGSLRTWDARTGACVRSHKKKGQEVTALVLLDKQPAVAIVGDARGGLSTWAFQTASKPQPLQLTLRSKVTHLVTLSTSGPTAQLTTEPSNAGSLQAQSDTLLASAPQLVAAACGDGTVSLVDVETGREAYCFHAHRGPVQAMSGGDWSATPASLRSMGCVLLVTASGDEGNVKVWQVSIGSRTPTATLLATLGGSTNRHEGGRHAKQRSAPNQWMSACALPTSGIHPALLSPSGSGSHDNHHLMTTADHAAAHTCWVAIGQGSGEIHVHRINTSNGQVSTPYKLSNVHNRPIYSVVAMPTYATAASVLPAASAPITHQQEKRAADQANASTADKVSEADQIANETQTSDSQGAAITTSPMKNGTTSVGDETATGIVLASISQDRMLTVTRLNFGMKPVSTGKAGKAAAKQGKKQGQPTPEAQPSKPATAYNKGTNSAAYEQQPDASLQSTKQPTPGPAVAASAGADISNPVTGAALHPAGPVSGEPVSNNPDMQVGSSGGGGHQMKAAKALPTFRVALGPPTDRTQKGFVGRGRGIALPPATGQQHTPGQANDASIAAPGVPSAHQQLAPEHETAAAGTVEPSETATNAPVTQPTRIVTPVIPSSLQMTADSEVEQQVAGELQWQVTSHNVAWRCQGLGGYAHHIAVQGTFQPAAQQEPPGQTAVTASAAEIVSGSCEWDVVTGCGDRTVRLTHIHWPVECEVKSASKQDKPEPQAAVGAGTGEIAGRNEPDKPTAHTDAGQMMSNNGHENEAQHVVAAQDAQRHTSSTVADIFTHKMQIAVPPPTIRNINMLWRGLSDQVICVAPHPASSRFIAFGCQDGQVGIFDLKENYPYLYPTRHQGPVLNLSWYAPTGVDKAVPAINSVLYSPGNKAKAPGVAKSNESHGQEEARVHDTEEKGMTPPPPPPLPTDTTDITTTPMEQVDETASVQATEHGTDGNQIVSPEMTQMPADSHNSKKQAAALHAAAVHAHCQLWQLVSCGAEGRLLAWQLPSAADLHSVGKSGLNPGQTGLPGSGTSRGGADRAGRWGAAAAAAPAEYANDLMVQLQPALKTAPDAAAGHHSVACMTVIPQDSGDLLVLASSSGALYILRGTSSHPQPTTTNPQPPQQQQQLGGKTRRRSSSGGGAAAAGPSPAISQLSWQLLWQGSAAGGAPSHIACDLPVDEPDVMLIAAASNTGSITCYRAHLAGSSPAGQGLTVDAPGSHLDSSSSNMFRSIQTNGGVTAMAWLLNGSGLAVATTQETPIQIWGLKQQQGGGIHTEEAQQQPSKSQTGKQNLKPVLLTSLRGHTDHVQCMNSKIVSLPAGSGKGNSKQLTHSDQHSVVPDVSLAKPGQEQRQLVWLFTASKDQSVRCWVLDLPQLWQQYHQNQQQLALAALQQQEQAAEQQQQDSQPGDVATPHSDADLTTQPDDNQLPIPHEGENSNAVQIVSPAQQQEPQAAVTSDTSLMAVQGALPAQADIPSYLAAAPLKSELAGIPGGRGKGAKKPPVLADKPLLGDAANVAGASQVTAAQVHQAAIAAVSQLNQLLASEAAGNGHPPPGKPIDALGSSTGDDHLAAVQRLVSDTADPVALSASGQLPHSPERLIMFHLWQGNVRKALQLAIEHQLLTADLVSVSASMGRPVWSAASRLYAAQQEAAGQVHVAAMHLIGIGDRASATAVYRRAGLFKEAEAVDGVPSLLQASH